MATKSTKPTKPTKIFQAFANRTRSPDEKRSVIRESMANTFPGYVAAHLHPGYGSAVIASAAKQSLTTALDAMMIASLRRQ